MRTGLGRAAAVVLACAAAAGCTPVAAPAPPVAAPSPPPVAHPAFPAVPTGDGCGEVIVIGDSIAAGFGPMLSCDVVHPEAISGSAPCQWLFWIGGVLAAHPSAEVVVAHFMPNDLGCVADWMADHQAQLAAIRSTVEAAGMTFVPVAPAPSYFGGCDQSGSEASQRWRDWAVWVAEQPGAIDLRSWFGHPTVTDHQRTFVVDGTPTDVRAAYDCIHLTDDGDRLAGQIVSAHL